MNKFPQIMPFSSSGNEVGGYLTARNEEFYVHLTVTGESLSRKIYLRGCEKLNRILGPVANSFEQHVKQCQKIEDMLSELQNILDKQLSIHSSNQSESRHAEYTVLFQQLQACGWERVVYINSDFNELHLKAVDESDREHCLKVWISDKFPEDGPRFESDLPLEFQYKWFPGDTMLNILTAFEETLKTYAEFWNNMDEIDQKTWVLEPEKPTRKDCRRRIALVVNPVRETFNKNIQVWSEYDSILQNLQQVLEIEFPSPTTSVKEEFCMECAICYSYLLEEAIPDMTCDNQNCSQPFHHACLYEYIRTLPDVKNSFNKLFGSCPYCNSPLWCTIP